MKYVLGLDQGGSKTHAAVANDRGELLGIGTSFGACHSVNGMEPAMEAVRNAAEEALAQAGIPLEQIDYIAGGLTGIDWDYETALVQNAVASCLQKVPDRVHVVNDCMIALRAASSKPSGCILCVGSGMNCGVRKDAEHEYAYGYYIEDRCQGGGALGARVVQAVLDSEAGLLPPTKLTVPVLDHVGCASPDEMLYQRVNGQLPHKKVLRLPEVLEKVALEGDPVADEVLCTFARDIARYVTAGLRRFDMQNDPVEVVFSGSVFKCRARILHDTVTEEILAVAPQAKIVESVYEPIIGAVLLALDILGCGEDPAVLENIRKTAEQHRMLRQK